MVMSHTLIQLIREKHPNANIDVIAPGWTEGIIERFPEVRHAHALPIQHGELALKRRYEIAKSLRQFGYDQVFVLPNSFKSALLPLWAKINTRTGWLGEMRYHLLNDARQLDKAKYPLMIERFAALAFEPNAKLPKALPKPVFKINQTNQLELVNKLQLDKDRPIIGLCPGAEYGEAKRWPTKHFAAVASHYINKGYQVWIFGSDKDKPFAKDINAQCNQGCADLTGRTSLGDAIDLLSLCHGVVTNDSGLMHISAAVGTYVVAIYGSSSAEFTPPLSDRVSIINKKLACSPCFERTCPLSHLDCLNTLMPNTVIKALDTGIKNVPDQKVSAHETADH